MFLMLSNINILIFIIAYISMHYFSTDKLDNNKYYFEDLLFAIIQNLTALA